jgi:hypothetical protein
MAFSSDWTPDWSGYESGNRSTEAMRWKGGYPERVWREQGPDAYRAWLVSGRDAARRANPKEYWGSPASWFEPRINAFDFWRAEQNRQPAYPDLSGDLSDTQKQLADLQSQFEAYRTSQGPSTEKTPKLLDVGSAADPLGSPSNQGGPLMVPAFDYPGGSLPIPGQGFNPMSFGRQPYNPMPPVQQQYRQPLDRITRVRPAKERGRSLGTQQFNRNYRPLPI